MLGDESESEEVFFPSWNRVSREGALVGKTYLVANMLDQLGGKVR